MIRCGQHPDRGPEIAAPDHSYSARRAESSSREDLLPHRISSTDQVSAIISLTAGEIPTTFTRFTDGNPSSVPKPIRTSERTPSEKLDQSCTRCVKATRSRKPPRYKTDENIDSAAYRRVPEDLLRLRPFRPRERRRRLNLKGKVPKAAPPGALRPLEIARPEGDHQFRAARRNTSLAI